VNTTVNYYYQTFVPLRAVADGGVQAAPEIPKLIAGLASQLHMTPTQVQQFLGTDFPAMAKLLESFPQLVPISPTCLRGSITTALVTTMKDNVHNYAQIDSLPNFNCHVVLRDPGILLVVLGRLGPWSLRCVPAAQPRRLEVRRDRFEDVATNDQARAKELAQT